MKASPKKQNLPGGFWCVEVCAKCKRRCAGFYVGPESPYKKASDIKLRKCVSCSCATRLELDGGIPQEFGGKCHPERIAFPLTNKQADVIRVLAAATMPLSSKAIAKKANVSVSLTCKVLRGLLDRKAIVSQARWRGNSSYTRLYAVRDLVKKGDKPCKTRS